MNPFRSEPIGSSAAERASGLSVVDTELVSTIDQTIGEPSVTRTAPRLRMPRRAPVSGRFLWRRLIGALVSAWGALTVVFIALNAGGSPVPLLAGPTATQAEIAELNHQLGYDRSLPYRYVTFFKELLTGNMPKSLQYNESPMHLVWQALPYTLLLSCAGLAVALVIGLVVGFLSATSRRRFVARGLMGVLLTVQGFPPILLGTLFVFIVGVRLQWLPTGGTGGFEHLILPALTLGLCIAPPIARLYRVTLVGNLGADHVRTALAKGISLRVIMLRHVAMNSLIPVVNFIGVIAGALLSGAVVVETLFSWPGVGTLAINSLGSKDYPVVLTTVCIATLAFISVNLLVDILGAVLDPRVRFE